MEVRPASLFPSGASPPGQHRSVGLSAFCAPQQSCLSRVELSPALPVPAATETEPKSILALPEPAPACANPVGWSGLGCHLCREKGQQGSSPVHSTASPLPTQSPRCPPHSQCRQCHLPRRALLVPSPVQSAACALSQPPGDSCRCLCPRDCVQTQENKVRKQERARLPAGRVGKQCQWDRVGSKSP